MTSKTPDTRIEEPDRGAMIVNLDGGGFWYHKRAFVYCAIASLASFQFGLDSGSIAGFQAMPGFLKVFGYADPAATFGYNINTTVQQLISALMSIGALVSCVFIGPLGKYLSRRWMFFLGFVFNSIAIILMILTTNVGGLYAGRLIVGLANGLFSVMPQLYIHECAPSAMRGTLFGFYSVVLSVGLLVGTIVNNATSTDPSRASYRIPLGVFFIVPTILTVLLPFMPETPRWLAEHGQEDKARESLVRLRNQETSSQMIDAELQEIKEAIAAERDITQGVKLFDMFKGTNLRRTLLSVAIMASLSGTGALFFLGYGTYFFAMAGQTKAFQESVGMTTAGLVGTMISMWFITFIGRRKVLLTGFAAQSICMLIVAVVYTADPHSIAAGRCLVAFVVIYNCVYSATSAPYLYLMAGEIPSQRLRGYTLGAAVAVSFLGSWLMAFTAPYFINIAQLNWGPKYGYIWFGSNFVIFVFIFFFVPETQGRSLEEIDEIFEARIPARKFKSYVCVKSNDARLAGLHIKEKGEEIMSDHVETVLP